MDNTAELTFGFSLQRGSFRLDVNLALPARGVIALFGRSGCGKTTILRCVAGLEQASGYCRLNGKTWQDDNRGLFLPTHRRPVGFVFQEPSLFPHLSVRRNLEYGFNRVAKGERQVGFDEVVDLLGIERLLNRDPIGLSGGERQRVSMARALLVSPQLLLMDEPLSALDQKSRQEILPYLERLHDTLKIPLLYVSHSADEVARLADQLVLLEDGRVSACGPTMELINRPDLSPTCDEKSTSIIEAVVRGHDDHYHLSEIEIPGGRLAVPRLGSPVGADVRIRIQARDVVLALEQANSSAPNLLPVRIVAMEEVGRSQLSLRLLTCHGETPLSARITCRSRDTLGLTPGMTVYAQINHIAVLEP